MLLIYWWLDGLLLLCPTFIREVIKSRRRHIIVECSNDQIIVKYYSDKLKQPLTTYSFNVDDETDKASVLKFIRDQKKNNAIIILALPRDIILKTNLLMPIAVKSALRQALAFEISRKTPFTAEQVFFDYTITQNDNKLNINLFIVPINQIELILEKIHALNIIYDQISFEDETGLNSEINLVKENTDSINNNNFNMLTATLSIITTILFITLLYLPNYLQSETLKQLEYEVNQKRKEVALLQSLIKEKNMLFKQSEFLSKKRIQQFRNIELINEITRVTPDDTWLNRLLIKSGKIQLQGESANASTLLQMIEASEFLYNSQFSSPIIKNNLTQKDKFNLSTNINKDDA